MNQTVQKQLEKKCIFNFYLMKYIGVLFGFANIILILYFSISSYIPYAQHKNLIDIKKSMISISALEKKFYEENKRFANLQELFENDKKTYEYKGYIFKMEPASNLEGFMLVATAKDDNNSYPNCNKLILTPTSISSYDTYGLYSKGCW